MQKKWIKRTKIILAIYVGLGIALYFTQDYSLFHPIELGHHEKYNFTQKHEDITIAQDGTDSLNLIVFAAEGNVKRGIVLYFHGNKKNIGWYAKYISNFTKQGYQVFMIDYPGYGKSRGELTEEKLYNWALQSYKIARKRFPADSIIIYGKSMGTGIAAELASIRDCKALILETPYKNFPSVMQHYLPIYPVKWMLHYQLPTNEYLKNVTAPVTILQGTDDRVITYSNAESLKPLLKANDKFYTIKGGSHNDLFDFKETREALDSVLTQ